MRRKFINLRNILSFAAVILLSVIAFNFLPPVQADTNYFALSPGNPLTQNWTNIGLISINDDWSGVPSINGYRGDGLATGTGANPQTVLGESTVLDVNANQNNPNSFATGGATEFEITDPTVALRGSGTASAPYIDIRLDTRTCAAPNLVNISYNLRDIQTPQDAVSPVALQYRVGSTGNYTNVAAGFVADASAPGGATLVTPVAVNLPAIVAGQPQIHVRIITTDAAGTDEWIGVDDINVTCQIVTAASAAIGGRVTAEGSGLARQTVMLSGGSLSQPIYTTTNSFGSYAFNNLPVGETYIVTVLSKRYTFANPTRVITLQSDALETSFEAAAPEFGRRLK